MDEIQSLQHPYIKHLVKLRSDRHYRASQQRFVLCGHILAREAINHTSPIAVLTTSRHALPAKLITSRVILVTSQILSKIAGHPTEESIVLELSLPPPRDLSKCKKLLILENVQDPGNLGNLLRTAAALGWDGVLFLPGCADPFNDKVIRAARGAPLWLPYNFCSVTELASLLIQGEFCPFVGHTQGISIGTIQVHRRLALVLANEGSGPSDAILRLFQPVTIPLCQQVESLNVASAGAILMYALARPKSDDDLLVNGIQ